MASLKLMFGWIPKTAKIEADEAALTQELKELEAYLISDELKHFDELEAIVTSTDFINNKKAEESKSYKKSDEYKLEKEYLTLKKSKSILSYFKMLDNPTLAQFTAFTEKSKEKQESEESEDPSDLKEKKAYAKFEKSKAYKNYLAVKGSQSLDRLSELETYVNSQEFIDSKAYLLDKKRFEKSEEYKQLTEYKELVASDKVKWFKKVKDSNKFDELKKQEILFSDEFDAAVDTEKWLTKYFWGEKLLKDDYAISGDLHFFTPKNVSIENNVLKLCTKKNDVKGKAWTEFGFVDQDFAYTSGLVNTALSFKQKYGTFSAKIKLNDAANARNAFWLSGEKQTPHIDIAKTNKGKIKVGNFWQGESSKINSFISKLGSRYCADFFIYTLEWTQNSLVWKINGVVIATQTTNVPDEPMYIALSGGLDKEGPLSSMEVDWVRVYKNN